jgi:hypothetical protein
LGVAASRIREGHTDISEEVRGDINGAEHEGGDLKQR